MKKHLYCIIILSCLIFSLHSASIKEGDIIFQTSLSRQSKAIQIATSSKYSHVGIILKYKNKLHVYEAGPRVRYTPLQKWINSGKSSHYIVKRLKNANQLLDKSGLKTLRRVSQSFIRKKYDKYFNWSNKKIYCSELVWKIYNKAFGIKIGKLQRLKEFNLKHPVVKAKLKERYKDKIPYNEKVISPQAMFESKLLKTVIIK